MQTDRAPKDSPWGRVDCATHVADGIWSVSTASHGGYHLSPSRMREFRQKFPAFTTWAGGPWFEEDCDWAAVCLAFPEYFPADARIQATRTMARRGAG